MLGKAKCKILKEIRQKIADENDIPYVTRECTYQGDCSGTCPRCESELRYLERELEKRERLGKKVAVGALCAGITVGSVACTGRNEIAGDIQGPGPEIEQLSGEVAEDEPTPTPEIEELAGDVSIEQLEGEPEAPVPFCDPEYEEEALARLEGFDVFNSNYNEDEPDIAAKYCPEITLEEDILLQVVTTDHWDYGWGMDPGCISIYDVTDGVLLGTWDAFGRGRADVPNVYWDAFPGITLKKGHTYRVIDSDPGTWSNNEASGYCGFVQFYTDEDAVPAEVGTTEIGEEIAIAEEAIERAETEDTTETEKKEETAESAETEE